MNKRIQELVKQFATNLLNRSGYDMREYEPFLEETEKLVEAIVKECATCALQHFLYGAPETSADTKIKQHFGVSV